MKLGLIFVIGLIAGCGDLSSPDFEAQLKAVQVDTSTATLFEQLGETRQYQLLGLYSTPPGSSSEFTVRELQASGWDSADGSTLGIDGNGQATALRNGVATIRGRYGDFVSEPYPLTVAAPVLQAITLSPATASVPLGLSLPITATGSYLKHDGSSESRTVSETLSWSSGAPTVASVPAQGASVLLSTLQQSATAVSVRALATAADGSLVEGAGSYTVIAPELVQVLVQRSSNGAAPPFTVPRGGVLNLQAKGVYTDSATPRELPDLVSWTSADAIGNVLGLLRQPNGTLDVTGLNLGASSVTATTVKNDGLTAISSAPASITVGAAVLESLAGARITPNPANVAVDASLQLAVIGRYSDGSEAQLPAEDLNWSVADIAVAGINSTGVALGKLQGGTVVTAALKQAPASGAGSVSAPLTVTDAICTGPLLAAQGATVASDTLPVLCLACTVSDETSAIDNDLATYAGINVNVGLLGGYAELTASAPAPVPLTTAGQRAGFIISRPPGELLSLALLGGVSLSTLDADGDVLESADTFDGLRLTLLGAYVIGQDAYVLSMPVTQPFQRLRVRMNAGLATVAQSLQVNSSCAIASQ
ncbi:MAG: hypothetical protein Q8Q73_06370 [Stagnimonas sp.]|nr:hypothetical protein [Stagnimonas sp.]